MFKRRCVLQQVGPLCLDQNVANSNPKAARAATSLKDRHPIMGVREDPKGFWEQPRWKLHSLKHQVIVLRYYTLPLYYKHNITAHSSPL